MPRQRHRSSHTSYPRKRRNSLIRRTEFRLVVLLAVALLGTTQRMLAQAEEASHPSAEWQDAGRPSYFENRGRWNFGFHLAYAVGNAIPRNISHINMLIAQPQVGLIVSDFHRGPVRRFEILGEGILGNAVHPGGHLLGTSLFLHFDFKPRGRYVPFLDVGSGVLHTPLSTRAPELSGNLQFLPQAGLGIQHYFSPQRALVIEYRYIHMSNAGIEPPNEGFNASMLSIGFRWLRRPRPANTQPSARARNPFRFLARAW